ncbi:MAG TPA: hypothetical protein VF039_04030 [Longimicrobiales bacterium]
MKKLLSGLAVLTAVSCQSGGAQTATPARPSVVEVVVANQQSASATVIQGTERPALHLQVGNGPHEAAISPDGRSAVVTIYGAQQPGSQLAVIDLMRDSVVRTIELAPYMRPHGVVFLGGSNTRVAVTSEATQNVVLVDLASGEIEPVPTGARGSHMVAVNAAGTRGWTANVPEHTVTELDLVNRRTVRSIPVPTQPEGVAVTPDGSEVWVGSNATGAVTVISTESWSVIATLNETRFPYRLTASPDGRRMAIVDGMGGKLVIADVASHAVVGTIALPDPRGVAIAPDSRSAWVTLAGGEVAEVDLTTFTELRRFAVQASPDGVAIGWR